MIILYPPPNLSRFKPGRPPASSRKVAEDFTPNSPHQAKSEARRILSAGLSPQAWRIIDLLSTGGVLSAGRLGSLVSERSLQRLARTRILERLIQGEDDLRQSLETFGLDSDEHPVLYMLGPVGIEIATQRHDVPPPSGYQGYLLSRVLHDVIVNEIVLRLADAIGARGWTVEWLGKYEGALTDKAQKQVILEPDALIRFRKDDEERAFLLEYHNEDKKSRAALKVEKYEMAYGEGNWRQRWEVETFPPVLVVFWQPIVGTGYQNAVSGKKLNCTYFGKTLKAVIDGKLDEWINIATGQKESKLPKE